MTYGSLSPSEDNIRLIDDRHLGRAQVISTYVLLGDEVALVDPGPTSVLPALEQGLTELKLGFADVRSILLTHIHLDHAGATGTLVARYPHLKVYVHQRGAPHMVNPERLLSSATRLYGDLMEHLWGEFRAVPEQNVTVLSGGETLRLGSRTVSVYDAPGHASHHLLYLEQSSGVAFVGDVGGVRLPGSTYARPATPPPDIDLEAWDSTLQLLRSLEPRVLALTHFGRADDPQQHIESYRERLRRWAEVVREGIEGGFDEPQQIARLQAVADDELGAGSEEAARYQQATPLEQSWAGLARYWRKRDNR